MDKKNDDIKEIPREDILDLINKVLNSKEDDIDESYIDIMHININSFKNCFVDGYNNIIDFEKYKAYKINMISSMF